MQAVDIAKLEFEQTFVFQGTDKYECVIKIPDTLVKFSPTSYKLSIEVLKRIENSNFEER